MVSGSLSPGAAAIPADAAVAPDHPRAARLNALFAEALRAERSRDADGAVQALHALLELEPDCHRAWYRLGALALRARQPDRAIDLIGRAVALAADEPGYHAALGEAYRALQHWIEAEHHFRAALALAPGAVSAMTGLGIVLIALGRLHEGLEQLRACVRARPELAMAHVNLGNGLLAAGDPAAALAAYDRALALDPHQALALANRASALLALGRLQAAVVSAGRAAALAPDHVMAHLNHGYALSAAGRREAAARAFRAVLELDPGHEAARYFLAALEGGTPPEAAPPSYVREVFDRQAATFDEHLVGSLDYRGPEVLSALARRCGAQPGSAVLDLGCGTGLMGAALRDLAGRTVGIDLSPRMIERARERGTYDDLVAGDAAAVLGNAGGRFDLIAAADMFIYLGDLRPVLAAARRVAADGALLVFSLERPPGDAAPGAGYILQPSGRFAHARDYAIDAAAAEGWRAVADRPFDLRLEGGRPVPGLACAMRAN